jgi:non-heme chloroperoxidase
MPFVKTEDKVEIYYKDWGSGQPIVFHHGWPLSADDWDAQMLYFLHRGYRVIAHDRRGHGRSSQPTNGHDMEHYAADVIAMTRKLELHNAVHVGHSTGGGEVVAYVARAAPDRVSKAVLIDAVPPTMVKRASYPDGLPRELFDELRANLARGRAQFYLDFASGPFYGFNRPGARVVEGAIRNWWRQAMMGAANAHYDCIKAFSETDFTEDLKKIAIPVLVMHGDDDQVVPYANAQATIKLLKKGTLKTYEGFSHGAFAIDPDVINADMLAFIKG